jgi:hypothetical protein
MGVEAQLVRPGVLRQQLGVAGAQIVGVRRGSRARL